MSVFIVMTDLICEGHNLGRGTVHVCRSLFNLDPINKCDLSHDPRLPGQLVVRVLLLQLFDEAAQLVGFLQHAFHEFPEGLLRAVGLCRVWVY